MKNAAPIRRRFCLGIHGKFIGLNIRNTLGCEKWFCVDESVLYTVTSCDESHKGYTQKYLPINVF